MSRSILFKKMAAELTEEMNRSPKETALRRELQEVKQNIRYNRNAYNREGRNSLQARRDEIQKKLQNM